MMNSKTPKTTKSGSNKQTIWLSTMMVLSLMLIGYYTVGNPGSSTPTSGLTPANYTADKSGKVDSSSADASKQTNVKHGSSSEYFVALESSAATKMMNEQQQLKAVITNAGSKPEDVTAAQQKLTTLESLLQKQSELEDKIVQMGFNDAIVTGDADKIDVLVQADSLDAAKAVQIISMVKQDIPTISEHNITVGSHK